MSLTGANNSNNSSFVWYNGHYVPAKKDDINGKWYADIDGIKVEVDPNDLFGMNKKWDELTANYNKQIEDLEKDYGKKSTLKKYHYASYWNADENCKKTRQKIKSFMKNLGLNLADTSKLTGEEKVEAKKLLTTYNSQRKEKNEHDWKSNFLGELLVDIKKSEQRITENKTIAEIMRRQCMSSC